MGELMSCRYNDVLFKPALPFDKVDLEIRKKIKVGHVLLVWLLNVRCGHRYELGDTMAFRENGLWGAKRSRFRLITYPNPNRSGFVSVVTDVFNVVFGGDARAAA